MRGIAFAGWVLALGWTSHLAGGPTSTNVAAGASAEPASAAESSEAAAPSLREGAWMDVVENFRVPLEKHANGRVKSLLHARRARMLPDGTIAADQLRIEIYDATGALTGAVRAEDAVVDQVRRVGSGKGPVRMDRQGVTISGVGLTWTGSESLVRIESGAVVELERFGKTLVEGWR